MLDNLRDPTLIPLRIDPRGWCPQIEQHHSPNFGTRPAGIAINLLVIHNISLPLAEFCGPHIVDLFLNRLEIDAHPSFHDLRGVQVSSHFLIRRDGHLIQFVSTLDRAWHAGVSCFEEREGCNDYSIGIELEGCDFLPFTSDQYLSLQLLSKALIDAHPIEHIVGHDEIAPGRKTDPGPCFDWNRYANSLPHWDVQRSGLG
ncbi:1,6-anhydro-N-acetylmuramyl-L-alanine amidase AmpD [Undibacterium sp. FT137W]|uniref:1,6-anhydro-N-acetylmuramyl-L-alanine amidase AmpD n=2 Tax=Undibacterium fentianense TaxID=2828728 RepID=A0A941E1R1_9BURK|nr:1,6-anhydro-N-acetylmuramyl-L-alanine amidase AmpD [Undibacterium fentianense]